jgi:hypothetical protein
MKTDIFEAQKEHESGRSDGSALLYFLIQTKLLKSAVTESGSGESKAAR